MAWREALSSPPGEKPLEFRHGCFSHVEANRSTASWIMTVDNRLTGQPDGLDVLPRVTEQTARITPTPTLFAASATRVPDLFPAFSARGIFPGVSCSGSRGSIAPSGAKAGPHS